MYAKSFEFDASLTEMTLFLLVNLMSAYFVDLAAVTPGGAENRLRMLKSELHS